MPWYRGPSGSAQDLIELQKEESTPAAEVSKLRRVLTYHAKRRKKKAAHHVGGFCLHSVLKEPLCLVNSVPLNFEFGSGKFLGAFDRRMLIKLSIVVEYISEE
ncbi:uncharacterized protein TNIN_127441 [Trichonephila inaurata madagascariensis]|uniref:Uncharacterized protein n=1 Tax=Trichonephila inaurata madagascariensis TaxID=2747483 RepID=A0A8X6YWA4_9ARAC|nr:uncharacterized protein TNIN_127441 [Trichonephila inaurata madagascariensis]